ncbi:endonuclease NucS [Paenibacillus polymyxa]|uniref:endonuclease NucS domain-containing protein n=1 Tax=Paenibacillus polymyxa TaxID=1406 RepID=UPI002023DE9E|nr:endonuclease NucS domain-containing protein [Paenibacillus polymyxa]URJ46981.1 endonuclease NucS [Paenibacillus polymyxa]
MPIELGIWKINGAVEKIHFSSMETERKLEDVITHDISIIDPSLLLIGRQINTAFGKFIDILAMNSEGNLVIIELKRNKTLREVVAQTLDYASWVQQLNYTDIIEIYSERNPGKQLEQDFVDYFQTDLPEILNELHQLIIVSAELDPATERIINYLTNFGVPINALFFHYFKDGDNEYLARNWLIDPNKVEVKTSNVTTSKTGKAPWNGKDFYISLGDGDYRNWEDCRRYGFISAGQGKWYSRSLNLLKPGARIFACIPKVGYVGVGIVQEEVVPIKEFQVMVNGVNIPLLDADIHVRMDTDVDGPDLCEYVVRVEWVKTVSKQEAIWEKGMFANQNSACKLRNQFTIERLTEHFRLEEEN